jgi:hypothetical protein
MDTLNNKDLKHLSGISGEWCVSLYLPTHRVGRETQQDPIRLRNLSTQAQERLIEYGARRPEAEKLMRPVEALLGDASFWQHQGDGLAVFLSPEFSQTFRLPSRFDALAVVGRRFHIKPLLPLLNGNGQFHILAISLNGIRLFMGTRDSMTEVDLSTIPTSMEEALHMDDPEKHLDFHTGSTGTGRRAERPAIFHGQGTGSDEDDKKDIRRFFHYFNKGLGNVIEDREAPMVLVGVDYLLPIYRGINSYPGLIQGEVTGSPEGMSEKEMHRRAWELVKPVFEARRNDVLERFERLKGQQSDLVTTDLGTAVKAAVHGGVESLLIPEGVQRWGRYVMDEDQMILEEDPSPENEDMLDLASRQTFLNSGKVFVVQSGEIPGGDIGAILRFEIQS